VSPNAQNIGHAKLFIVGEEAQRNISPQTTVNNFVGAQFGWCRCFASGAIFIIRGLVFRTGGPGLLTSSRDNDFELYRPAAGLA
jgi:hypothetical protein